MSNTANNATWTKASDWCDNSRATKLGEAILWQFRSLIRPVGITKGSRVPVSKFVLVANGQTTEFKAKDLRAARAHAKAILSAEKLAAN